MSLRGPSDNPYENEPEGGPIVFTFHFIGVDNGTGIFNLIAVFAKKITENVLFDWTGWTGWRVGRDIESIL